MKILVTGGAGYLGSVLSLALIEAGHDVRVIDNVMYGGRALLPVLGHPRFEFIAGDLRDSRRRRARGRAASTPSSTWRRSSAIRPARAIQKPHARSTKKASLRLIQAAGPPASDVSSSPRPAATTAA